MPCAQAAIGVFDSGVGGLSVLAALRRELPLERFVYFSDAAHAPYGEREDAYVRARTLDVAEGLQAGAGIKLLVVACNTATAAAVAAVRERWPGMPVVGVEPALKPAATASRTRSVAVLATRGTLGSSKYRALQQAVCADHPDLSVRTVACDGLASAIEVGDGERIDPLVQRYLQQAGPLGHAPGQADCVVLGCTHYPFAMPALAAHVPAGVQFIDTGAPVARQARRLLAERELLNTAEAAPAGTVELRCSGDPQPLQAFAAHWLA